MVPEVSLSRLTTRILGFIPLDVDKRAHPRRKVSTKEENVMLGMKQYR